MNSDISICCLFQKYGYTHLSAGELLRDERKNPDSQYGELIEKYIKEGKIVPVEITISLLKRVRSMNTNLLKLPRTQKLNSPSFE
jgi:adenylate kinase family enzyme